MRNPFVAIFVICLLLLIGLHALDGDGSEGGAVKAIAIVIALAAAVCYILGHVRTAYGLVALAIGLLIAGQFLVEKERFNRTVYLAEWAGKDRYISIEGRLTAYPELRRDHSVVVLETRSIRFKQRVLYRRYKLRIKVKGYLGDLNRGDIIALDAKIYQRSFNRNFFANSIADYTMGKGIHFSGYCKSKRLVRVVERAGPVWQLIGNWRASIRAVIQKKYRNSKGDTEKLDPKGIFLMAILTGDRGELTGESREELLGAGVFHLLAISGAHIGIIALFCLGLLKLLKVPFKTRYFLTAGVLLVFFTLSGFKISAERAVLMALFIFTARLLYQDIHIFNIISLCGIFMLARNPGEFLDAGFVLTFVLTAAIVVGRRIAQPFLEAAQSAKRIPSRLSTFLVELLTANVSASIAALPLSLYFFKRYSFAGIITGLVLVPLTAVITGLGILLIPLALFSPVLSYYLLYLLDLPLALFFMVVRLFSDGFSIYRASPSILVVLFMLFAFFLLPLARSFFHKTALWTVVLGLVSIMVIGPVLFYYSPKHLEVYYLDVGQGDSQLVVFPGGDALLIDGGGAYFSNFRVGHVIVLPFLLQKRIRVKWAAVSHYHPDHVSGLTELLPILNPEEIWLSSAAPGQPAYEALISALPGKTRIIHTYGGFKRQISGCMVEQVYPVEFKETRHSRNDDSQVLQVSDGYHTFLFTGDIERRGEEVLTEKGNSSIICDVLKVPHHGSRTSSSGKFLDHVSPGIAIFTCAVNNRFGFPHREVLERYKARGINYFSTARSGGIKLISAPDGIKIEVSR